MKFVVDVCGCLWMFVDESGCRMVGWIGEGEGEGVRVQDSVDR